MTISATQTVKLSDNLIIGKGRDRICYEHPTDSEQCIKISIKSNKQSKREVRYFNFLKRRKADLSKISTYLGKVITSRGIGYSFYLIRDFDGKVSRTLKQCIESRELTIQDIRPSLVELKSYLITNKICVRDISPSNISCQKTHNGINLFIIDGVSNASINPLTIRYKVLVNAAIEKSWKSLDRKLNKIQASLEKGK